MSTHQLPTEPERPREAPASGRRPSGWHAVNTGHLVMGVAFLGLVVVWALVTSDTVELTDRGWIMGLPWLVAGATGLLATVLRRRDPQADWGQDWKQDQQVWKEQFHASHRAMKDELRQHTQSWGHSQQHDHEDRTGH